MSQWNAIKLKLLCEILQKESHVIRFEYFLLIHEYNEIWWPDSCLNNVVNFKGALTVFWQVIQFFKFLKPVIKQTCAYSFIPLIVSCDDLIHHLVNVQQHFCTDKYNRATMKLTEIFLHLWKKILSCFVFVLILDRLPFIDNDNNRSSLSNYSFNEFKIIDLERWEGIHNINDNMSRLHM